MSYTFVFIQVAIESKKELPLVLEKAMVVKPENYEMVFLKSSVLLQSFKFNKILENKHYKTKNYFNYNRLMPNSRWISLKQEPHIYIYSLYYFSPCAIPISTNFDLVVTAQQHSEHISSCSFDRAYSPSIAGDSGTPCIVIITFWKSCLQLPWNAYIFMQDNPLESKIKIPKVLMWSSCLWRNTTSVTMHAQHKSYLICFCSLDWL